MDKKQIVAILNEIAVFLELKGENPFKTRAYSNAARLLEADSRTVDELLQNDDLKKMKGIGTKLADRITTLARTDRLEYYEELKAFFPETLLDLLRIPNMGPKKVKTVYEELGVDSIGALEYACQENRLVTLAGFGEKTQQKLLDGIVRLRKFQERNLLNVALAEATSLVEHLERNKDVSKIEVAGSIRRRCETVKDIDILVSSKHPQSVTEHFLAYPDTESITGTGEKKTSLVLKSGMNADLRVVTQDQFPYALHHFTGSREHNTAMRTRAKKKGLKMNEYGLFNNDDTRVACEDEASLFEALSLQYISPELRENLGEIEAAEQNKLPLLVQSNDILGLFHVHSTYSDGKMSLGHVFEAGRSRGYQYVGIADHSQSAKYANGLDERRINEQHEAIDEINSKLDGPCLLKGIECDILKDGALDYSDGVLAKFDFVIASIHSGFSMSESEMTARILKAMSNPYVTMLGHPTGRLLLARDPYPVDIQAVLDFASEQRVCIEINANPHRLDLDWRNCRKAKQLGIPLAICPDAHQVEGFDDMVYGLAVARKGWLSPQDIVNVKSLEEIRTWLALQRKRRT